MRKFVQEKEGGIIWNLCTHVTELYRVESRLFQLKRRWKIDSAKGGRRLKRNQKTEASPRLYYSVEMRLSFLKSSTYRTASGYYQMRIHDLCTNKHRLLL